MLQTPQSLLFVLLGPWGDVVDALCAATAVKRAAPRTHIGWAVEEHALPLISGHPSVDRAHHLARGAGAGARRALAAELRSAGYAVACDLGGQGLGERLVRSSGAARRFSLPGAPPHRWTWPRMTEQLARGPGTHRVDAYLGVARHLGAAANEPTWELPADPRAASWAEAQVAELGAAPLVLNIGARQPTNRWNPNHFGELARLAHRDFPEIPRCLVGGASDAPSAVRAMSMTKKRHGLVNLVGQTSLPQLWELLRRSRLLVTGNSGCMQLARALGTPLVVLASEAALANGGPYPNGQAGSPWVQAGPERSSQSGLESFDAEQAYPSVAEALRS